MSTGRETDTRGHWFISDLLSSVVVFLVAMPLSIGIAIASGVPDDKAAGVGILTAIVGGIVVGILAGCPLQVTGPAAGLAVMVSQFISDFGWENLSIIVLVAGAIQLLAGLLRFGQWFRAAPPAVIEGMLAGIGVLIFASQFHIMVDDKPPGTGQEFGGILNLVTIPEAVYKGLTMQEHRVAAIVGLTTIIVITLWVTFAPVRLRFIPGPLVGVIVAAIMAAIINAEVRYVSMPPNILDAAGRAPVDALWSQLVSQPDLTAKLKYLLPLMLAGLALAFVASAETLLTATAADSMQQHAPRTNYDRELLAQGVGNSICGALQLLPMTGVIVRTATNIQSGARTRLSTIMHGFWLLIFCALVPQVLGYIPIASLAAVLVYTGVKLFKWRNFITFWNLGIGELAIYVVTMGTIVVVDLLTGIIVGIILAMAKLLFVFSHLDIRLELDHTQRRANMFLAGAATFIRLPKLAKALLEVPGNYELHIHLEGLSYIDHACLNLLANWEKQHEKTGGSLVLDWESLTAKFRQVGQNASNNTQNNQNSSSKPSLARRNS
ncbi:MAG: SulP family inorganic anion transporter [Gemmatales bacterium]|nr:SulP family inorganic anion transporter [Gemmatales bacterium]